MTAFTAEDACEAVERGAAWLDLYCPGWERKIDLLKLDMADGSACMLGQTARCILSRRRTGIFDYVRVAEEMGWTNAEAVRLGFQASFSPYHEWTVMYEMLQIAWVQKILERIGSWPIPKS